MAKKTDTKKSLPHHYNNVKTELEKVYVTSSGDKYLKKMDAYCAESQIQQAKKSRERRRKKIMDIVNILLNALKENNWGVFYRNQPIRDLETQDGGTLYEVNQVDLEEVERVVMNQLEKKEEWKHTEPPTQEDSTQS